MPSFQWDINPKEYIESLDSSEVESLIDLLQKRGHIKEINRSKNKSILQLEFEKSIYNLAMSFHSLSQTEIEIIELIAKKHG